MNARPAAPPTLPGPCGRNAAGSALLAVLLLAPATEAKKMPAEPALAPAALVRAAVSFSAPAGWREDAHANGPDPVLELRKDLDRISLSLFGARGSAYATPAEYLRGPGAGTLGKPPQAVAELAVGGRKRVLYEHGVTMMMGDPHAPPGGGPPLATERFVLLPLPDGRFLVAAHRFESPVPSVERAGEKAFSALLKTLKPAAKPK